MLPVSTAVAVFVEFEVLGASRTVHFNAAALAAVLLLVQAAVLSVGAAGYLAEP
jgi:hypothetical protein